MLHCRHIICFLFLAFNFSVANAKENKDLMKADYYYSHYIYFKAIPCYEKVAEQMKDPAIYARLADCYAVLNEMQKAADAYSKAVAIKDCSPGIVLKYAQVLMQLTQYDEAKKWLQVYHDANQGDVRALNLIEGCNRAKSITEGIPDGVVTLMPFNTEGSDFGPTMWRGRLVFASDTAIGLKKKTDNGTGRAYYNLISVACDGKGKCGDEYVKVAQTKGVNIKYHDGPATFTADGKQMYFTRSRVKENFFGTKSNSNKDSTVVLEIMIASDFDTAAKKFKNIVPFQYNNETYAVQHPSVSPNGNMMAFSSNMPKGYGGSDIYWCKKTADGWSAPQNFGNKINTEGEEVFPYWGDNNTLFFSSDGHKGYGGLDIYVSRWDATSNTFTAPDNIGMPINSSYDDISLALFADERSTYFSSNRPAAKGGDNIYFYKKEKIFLQVTVLDSLTGQPLPGSKLAITSTKENKDVNTDQNGRYFMRLYPEARYDVNVHKDDYNPSSFDVYATTEKGTDTISRIVSLLKPTPPPRKQDTIPPIAIKRRNVMDTPGIREFEIGEKYELGHFHYDFNKYKLTSDQKLILDTMLAQMHRHPTMCIEIIAHTDCRGTVEYNLELSKNRALSVVSYLAEHGISRRRLEYKGVGYSEPTVQCPDCLSCTEEQHNLNRLLEFRVLKL
jgi:outer membrane protein OmpA-like peptidoglycan-associated protein/tetratricopeptide (TPR) repeat protein